jgi:hypothetical protein
MLPDFDRADAIGSYWGEPQDPRLRRAPDRLRGGPDAPGGARRDAAGRASSRAKQTSRLDRTLWPLAAGAAYAIFQKIRPRWLGAWNRDKLRAGRGQRVWYNQNYSLPLSRDRVRVPGAAAWGSRPSCWASPGSCPAALLRPCGARRCIVPAGCSSDRLAGHRARAVSSIRGRGLSQCGRMRR